MILIGPILFSSETWNSVAYKAIISPIPLGHLETSFPDPSLGILKTNPQHYQHDSKGLESYHLFLLRQEGLLRDKLSQAKEKLRHFNKLVTVLITSALKRQT